MSNRIAPRQRPLMVAWALFVCATASLACARTTVGARALSASAPDTILALTRAWVDTWNERDVEGMAALHADPANTRYGLCHDFLPIDGLLNEIRETAYFGSSWSIALEAPRVRMLGDDGAVASARLVGDLTAGGETRPFETAITLVFERIGGAWKIVHVQDADCPV